MAAPRLSRRALLIGGGGIAVAFGLSSCALVPPIPKRPAPTLDDALGWIQLTPEGRFVLWSPRAEMGQNVLGGLRRIAALELGLPEEAIDTRVASTGDIGRVKATVGSDSVRELLLPLARACASLREAVLERAAQQLGTAASSLLLRAEGVHAPAGRSLPLATLARPALRLVTADRPAASLRSWAALMAASASASPPAPQIHALVHGAPLFAADVRLPGMLHAAVLRAPWRRELGPRLLGWDQAAVSAVPGFVAQLSLPELDGPVLVARNPAALRAMHAVAAPRWQAPAQTPNAQGLVDIDNAIAAGRFTQDSGAVNDGPWTVDLRLDVPLAAHAAIEPRCAVARFGEGGLELWCATQDPFFMRDVMARDHGLPLDRIVVHNHRIGGGFGGRTIANVEREVAFIAHAMQAPVKLQWSREDEFVGGFHRPPSSHRVKVRVGADGMVSDWWHALSSSHIIFTSAAMPAWMQTFTNFVGDPGTARGQHAPYAFTRQRRSLQLTRLPLATGPWRGLGAGPNVLAIEAAMEAAARASGQDPVAFRLKHLAHAPAGEHLTQPARLAAVLQRVAARAATAAPRTPLPGERVGRGVACGVYKGHSVAAAMAEVSVTAERIRVTRLWCSHDCGAMVDARSVRAQVEGNLVWCMALVLSDELSAPQATPEQTNFAQYALPRMTDMPVFDIDLVPSTEAPTGAGETAIVAGAGAIYNAVVAATGKQPQHLPLKPEQLA